MEDLYNSGDRIATIFENSPYIDDVKVLHYNFDIFSDAIIPNYYSLSMIINPMIEDEEEYIENLVIENGFGLDNFEMIGNIAFVEVTPTKQPALDMFSFLED